MSDNTNGWLIFLGVLAAVFALSQCQEPRDGENCYDADPTQWTEIVCE